MVVIISSIKEEIAAIVKKTALLSVEEEKPRRLLKVNYNSRQILLLQTGMGKENAISSVSFVLDHYSVSTVISLGFAGALRDDLRAGDLVLYSKIFAKEISEPIKPDIELLSSIYSTMVSKKLKFSTCKGNSFTSDHIIYGPDQKRGLREKYGCIAVDMESYWVAYVCSKHGVPFVCARAISDKVRQRVPKMDSFINMGGEFSIVNVLKYIAGNPADFFSLISLWKNAYLAGKSLTTLFAITIDKFH